MIEPSRPHRHRCLPPHRHRCLPPPRYLRQVRLRTPRVSDDAPVPTSGRSVQPRHLSPNLPPRILLAVYTTRIPIRDGVPEWTRLPTRLDRRGRGPERMRRRRRLDKSLQGVLPVACRRQRLVRLRPGKPETLVHNPTLLVPPLGSPAPTLTTS